MRALTQKQFRLEAGDRGVLWISPRTITAHTRAQRPKSAAQIAALRSWMPGSLVGAVQPILKRREPFLISEKYFPVQTDLSDEPRYQLLKDFISHPSEVTRTRWYKALMRALSEAGEARHKQITMRSETEVIEFLTGYVGPLVRSLRDDGFSREVSSYDSKVLVDARGRLCKTGSGNHRFAIAHILGLEDYPVRLSGIHEAWWTAQGLGPARTEAVLACLPALEAAHR